MYTPEFLASQVPDLPPSAASVLQPYVANLAVSARARKSGVASALMHACEQVKTLHIHVRAVLFFPSLCTARFWHALSVRRGSRMRVMLDAV